MLAELQVVWQIGLGTVLVCGLFCGLALLGHLALVRRQLGFMESLAKQMLDDRETRDQYQTKGYATMKAIDDLREEVVKLLGKKFDGGT